jgi:hypothetical protein
MESEEKEKSADREHYVFCRLYMEEDNEGVPVVTPLLVK